uniref:Uncharacterized protein n=1 Tax=Anguilla anguilla TaxID=7936 RepID=A0A0E9XJ67_ANGAN
MLYFVYAYVCSLVTLLICIHCPSIPIHALCYALLSNMMAVSACPYV